MLSWKRKSFFRKAILQKPFLTAGFESGNVLDKYLMFVLKIGILFLRNFFLISRNFFLIISRSFLFLQDSGLRNSFYVQEVCSSNSLVTIGFVILLSRHLLVKSQWWKLQKRCEICSKLTIILFTVNFEQISHFLLLFPLLKMNK